MLFNSLEFLIFFPIVVGLYFACPYRWRWALLLAASYYFYAAWKLEYLVLILISTVVDYTVALAIARQTQPAVRTRLLAVSLTINLGLLFTFKYFNFFNDSLSFTMYRLFSSCYRSGSHFIPFRPSATLSMFIAANWSRSGILAGLPFLSPSFRSWWPARSSGPAICCPSSGKILTFPGSG